MELRLGEIDSPITFGDYGSVEDYDTVRALNEMTGPGTAVSGHYCIIRFLADLRPHEIARLHRSVI